MDGDSDSKPRLLVVKGTFEQFGGAERDLLNNLQAWQEHFEITLTSLHLPQDARDLLESLDILYLTPAIPWKNRQGAGLNSAHWPLARLPIAGGTCWN